MYEFLSDEFRDAVDELIGDAFYDLQEKLGIKSGDLPPLVEYHIESALDYLCDQIEAGMRWQAEQEVDNGANG